MPVRSFGVSFLAYLGLRSVLVLLEQAKMGEDEVLLNSYEFSVAKSAKAH